MNVWWGTPFRSPHPGLTKWQVLTRNRIQQGASLKPAHWPLTTWPQRDGFCPDAPAHPWHPGDGPGRRFQNCDYISKAQKVREVISCHPLSTHAAQLFRSSGYFQKFYVCPNCNSAWIFQYALCYTGSISYMYSTSCSLISQQSGGFQEQWWIAWPMTRQSVLCLWTVMWFYHWHFWLRWVKLICISKSSWKLKYSSKAQVP